MHKLFTLLDRLHWLWLLLAAPLMLFPSPKRSLAMLVVPGLWLLRWLVTRRGPSRSPVPRPRSDQYLVKSSIIPVTPLNGSFLLLELMVLISLWATYDIAFSLEKVSGVVLGLGVFYAVVRAGKHRLGWWLSLVMFLGMGLGMAGVGFLGTNWKALFGFLDPLTSRIPQLIEGLPGAETGIQPNAVGGALLWVLPLKLTLSHYVIASLSSTDENGRLAKGIWFIRIILLFSTLFVTGVLVLSQSRGSYLATGLTIISMLLIVFSPRWRKILLVVVLLFCLIAGVLLYRSGGWESFVSVLGLSDQSGLSINSLEARLEIWSRAIYGVQDFPFTGMGMNTFREVVHVLYPLFLIAPDKDIAHAHNEFLQAALDLGIPGLVAFLSIHIVVFWMLYDSWRDDKATLLGPVEAFSVRTLNVRTPVLSFVEGLSLKRATVLGLGGGLAAHMLFGITDAITLGAKPGLLWWMLLGLIASLHGQIAPVERCPERAEG